MINSSRAGSIGYLVGGAWRFIAYQYITLVNVIVMMMDRDVRFSVLKYYYFRNTSSSAAEVYYTE